MTLKAFCKSNLSEGFFVVISKRNLEQIVSFIVVAKENIKAKEKSFCSFIRS